VIDELGRELARVGIHGRQRERIVAEFADHLACDPDAELGDPHQLAAQFADDLATDGARRTALGAFAALAIVAVAVGVPQLALPNVPDITGGRSPLLVAAATLAMVVGAQIAFAAGTLAALRALRFGGVHEVPLVRRRVAVALGGGALTAAGSALYAVNFSGDVPGWWLVLAIGGAVAGVLPLTVSAFAHARLRGIAISQAGRPRGLSADLGPLAHPALIGVAAMLAVLFGTGILEGSVVEGAIRAAFEGIAFAACFSALRRPLALTG
jgi:hypothetical protein